MIQSNPTTDDRYRRYVDLLLCHHQLLCNGRHESDEADAVENEMTPLWDELDSAQQQSLSGLGSDLTWIRRRGQPAPRAKPADQVTDAEIEHVVRANDIGDWNGMLHNLRICGARLPAAEIARFRATAWHKLGFAKLSRLFDSFATELEVSQTSASK